MDCLREVAAYGFPATQLEIQTAGWSSISLLTQHSYCVAWVGAVFPKTPSVPQLPSLPPAVTACVSLLGRSSVFQIKTWAELFISARKLPGQTGMV